MHSVDRTRLDHLVGVEIGDASIRGNRRELRVEVSFPPFLGVLVYAAWAFSWSLGLVMLLAECRRSGLYQVSIHAAMCAW